MQKVILMQSLICLKAPDRTLDGGYPIYPVLPAPFHILPSKQMLQIVDGEGSGTKQLQGTMTIGEPQYPINCLELRGVLHALKALCIRRFLFIYKCNQIILQLCTT